MKLLNALLIVLPLIIVSVLKAQENQPDLGSIYNSNCNDSTEGTHGCPPISGLAGMLRNCTTDSKRFEYPSESGQFICLRVPSKEAWNVFFGSQHENQYPQRHPKATVPGNASEGEKIDCMAWEQAKSKDANGLARSVEDDCN